jgi:chromosome segregation ATPase
MMEKSEITKMKLQIAGYKGQVALLQKNIKDLEAIIRKKNGVIDELSNQVFDLQTDKEALANKLADANEYAASLEATIDTYYCSWWHRIFG